MKTKFKLFLFISFYALTTQLFADIHYLRNYEQIKTLLPRYTDKDLDGLIFRRQGDTSESYMDALGLHQVIHKNKAYILSADGLIASTDLKNSKKIPQDFKAHIKKPKSTIIHGKWKNLIATNSMKEEKISNILGKNGRLILKTKTKEITIPIEIATSETLGYYGGVAIPIGEKVTFPIEEAGYPIWAMSLGTTYVKDYIMSEKAGGWYLEWHLDRPHFHMPLSIDASGFYLLGKELAANTFEITAFKIPYGTAVFTKRGAIHSDSGLTGKRWAVGYTTSEHYATVLLRNQLNEYVNLKAIKG